MAHKKHKSQYISFLIIPDSQNEPKTFKFKRSVVSVFVGVLIFALSGMIAMEMLTKFESRFDKWRPKVGAQQ